MSEVRIIEDNTVLVVNALRSEITHALEQCGEACEGYAKDLCPVGTPESTGKKGYIGGTLQNSITHEVRPFEKAVYIGTNVDYGIHVEFGTWKMKAQPYLRPAASGHMAQYRQIFRRVLGS